MANVLGNANLKNLTVELLFCFILFIASLLVSIDVSTWWIKLLSLALLLSFLFRFFVARSQGQGQRDTETPDTVNDWNALLMLLACYYRTLWHEEGRRIIERERERNKQTNFMYVSVYAYVSEGTHFTQEHFLSLCSSSPVHSSWLCLRRERWKKQVRGDQVETLTRVCELFGNSIH